MRILFTSASKPAALALARVLAAGGHTIYAADEESPWGTAPARYARAYTRFYRLTSSHGLVALCQHLATEIDLVMPFATISTSDKEQLHNIGAHVVGDAPFRTTQDFQDFVRNSVTKSPRRRRPSAVKLPAAFEVHSRMCIAEILSQYPTTTFSLHPAPCRIPDNEWGDDEDTLVDLESPATSAPSDIKTAADTLVVSCNTLDDAMVEAIKGIPMSETKPYRLTEIAQGGTLCSAHAFLSSGELRTFVVTTGHVNEQDFVIVSSSNPLFEALRQFTQEVVGALGDWQSAQRQDNPRLKETGITNHLSLDFCIREECRADGDFIRKITVFNCTSDPHRSMILFCATSSLRRQLALAYMSPPTSAEQASPLLLLEPHVPYGLYSVPHAMRELRLAVRPFAPNRLNWWVKLARWLMMFLLWLVCFQEEMWDCRDPGPALCLWTVMLFGWLGKMRWARALNRVGSKAISAVRAISRGLPLDVQLELSLRYRCAFGRPSEQEGFEEEEKRGT